MRRTSAVEAAERAREQMARAGSALWPVSNREAARATGTLVTPGELAELSGEEVVDVKVITYRFRTGGRILPPVDLVVRCSPAALDGVYRSMGKLLESRGWSAEASVASDRLPVSALGRGEEQ